MPDDQTTENHSYNIQRIPTGIPGLDRMVGGGFVKNSSVLIRGDTGTLKTLLCLQYLYRGAIDHGDPGVFISFADSEEAIYQHGLVFDWDFKKLMDEKKFAVVHYQPHEVVKIMEEGGGVIRDTLESIGAKRIVIDSLTTYEMLFETKYRANESILDLFELLRKWNATTLVTSESPVSPGKGTTDRLGFLTDGIINLYHLRHSGKMLRALEVVKMRDTDHEEKIHQFMLDRAGLRVLGELGFLGRK